MLALGKKLPGMVRLGLEIMLVDIRSVLDLFDLDLLLISFGFSRFLFLLVAKAAIVHDLADDGTGIGGHFQPRPRA